MITRRPRFLQALRERLTRLGDTAFAELHCSLQHTVMEESYGVLHGTKLKACDTDTAEEQAVVRNKIISISRLRCLTAWLSKLIDEPLRQKGAEIGREKEGSCPSHECHRQGPDAHLMMISATMLPFLALFC